MMFKVLFYLMINNFILILVIYTLHNISYNSNNRITVAISINFNLKKII